MENGKVVELPEVVKSYNISNKEKEIILAICDIALKSTGLRGVTDILTIVNKFNK